MEVIMIDLHSHILPGLDDGSRTLEQSIAMACLAAADGIHLLAATPHHNNGRYANEGRHVQEAVNLLNLELGKLSIPLTVVPGQEIRLNDQFWGDWQAGKLLTLNGTRYLLIELPNDHVPKGIWEFVHEMKVQGIVAIIAHPERNTELANKMDILMELVQFGALSQVTAHSLNGLFGRKIRQTALRMCRRNLVHIVASDAHDEKQRPFGMREAYIQVNKEVGHAHVQYYQDNAAAIAEDKPIEVWEPKAEKRWMLWVHEDEDDPPVTAASRMIADNRSETSRCRATAVIEYVKGCVSR
jgi:protein-tyrosine phosphatase